MVELPEYLKNRTNRKITRDLASGLGSARVPTVSIMGGRFTLVDAAGQKVPLDTLHLDGIIVNTNPHRSRVYYAGPYDPANTGPPDCWSDNGQAPSVNAPNPQSGTCQVCPHSVWGSSVSANNKKVPKCSSYKKLALMIPGPGQNMVFLLRVPPASLKVCQTYTDRFKDKGIDVSDVVTRISFEPEAVGILNFQGLDFVPQELADQRDAHSNSEVTAAMVGLNDLPRLAPPAEDWPDIRKPAPMAQVAPPVAPAQQEVAAPPSPAEPPKRRGRPAKGATGPQSGAFPPFEPSEDNAGPKFGVGAAAPPPSELSESLGVFFKP